MTYAPTISELLKESPDWAIRFEREKNSFFIWQPTGFKSLVLEFPQNAEDSIAMCYFHHIHFAT